jgi:hypothetical protein
MTNLLVHFLFIFALLSIVASMKPNLPLSSSIELPSKDPSLKFDKCYTITNLEGKTICTPYFIIAGTFKSGTTSLYSYLSFHPEVSLNVGTVQEKETHFFSKTNFTDFGEKFIFDAEQRGGKGKAGKGGGKDPNGNAKLGCSVRQRMNCRTAQDYCSVHIKEVRPFIPF